MATAGVPIAAFLFAFITAILSRSQSDLLLVTTSVALLVLTLLQLSSADAERKTKVTSVWNQGSENNKILKKSCLKHVQNSRSTTKILLTLNDLKAEFTTVSEDRKQVCLFRLVVGTGVLISNLKLKNSTK